TGFEKVSFELESRNGYDPNSIFGNLPLPPKDKLFGRSNSALYSKCRCVEAATEDSIILRIRSGSYLRFNLIKVFGYILHRKNIELNTAYYTSLYFILTCIKLNHVNLLSMTSILPDIGFLKPNEQFIKIFEAMEQHLPPYLRCAATYWKEGIKSKTINMDNILMPYGDNTVVVDVLAGLLPKEIAALGKDESTTNAETPEEKKIIYNFNSNILELMRHIEKRKEFKPKPWFFAGFIQFFPRTLIQPDVEESIQLLTFYFYDRKEDVEKIKELGNIDKTIREPYKMIRHVLEKLFNWADTEDVIKDAADTVLRNLKPRSPTAVNPHYSSFTFFIQPDRIKIDEMLKYVSKCAFPLEIILAAERVRYYIDVKIIGYFTIMNNFNPYVYTSPMEVLIAILDRIMRRESNLAPEILNAVGAVYSYLIFKYRYSTMPVVYPTEMVNINILLMGMKAPDIPRDIRVRIEDLSARLMMEPLKYSELLIEKVPVYKCTTPVICLYYLLEEIIKIENIIDEDLKGIIIEIRNCTCNVGKCPVIEKPEEGDIFPEKLWATFVNEWKEPNITSELSSTTTSTTTTTTKTIMSTSTTTRRTTTVTTQPPPTSPSEGPTKTQSTLEPTEPTTPTAPPPSADDLTTLPSLVTETVPPNDKALLQIIQNITEKEACDIGLSKQQIMEIMEIIKKYEKDIKFPKENHLDVLSLYVTFIAGIKQEHNNALFEEWWKMWNGKKAIAEFHLENHEANMSQPVLGELIIALPTPENDNERKMFHLIRGILARQELFIYIHQNIKKSDEVTSGSLLKAVIREEVLLTEKLKKEEIEALKYYYDKVQLKGFGERKVSYGIIQKVLTITVSISDIMNNALDFSNLENKNKENFNKVIKFLKNNQVILHNWSTFYLHTTSGDFTQSLFKLLLSTPSVDADTRAAVTSLTPLINLDKDGLKPSLLKDGKGYAS
ncbi:hypothetical protein ILUMI_04526, partial [Ignelater luminosus]